MKILFSTSSLFPYRVEWLDALGKYSDVDIYYMMDKDSARDTYWCSKRPENCRYTLQKSKKFPLIGAISFDFVRVLKSKHKQYDVIILDGYGFASQLLNIWYLNRKKISYCVNIDGMVPKDKENPIIRWFKKKLLSRVPCCLCGSQATNVMLERYGVKKERILNHPFSSLHNEDVFKTVVTPEKKTQLREKLNISEKKVVISVGRFSYMAGYGKGYDVLLRSAKQMSGDIGWYIIGGNPTKEFADMKKEMQLENVHFIDFLKKEELIEYYTASDVFVLMTVGDVWGLVINESMACGLPVITTEKCVAGLDLVRNGKNGYILPVGDDIALTDKLNEIFSNPSLMEKMAQTSLEIIAPYTIENMAKIHIEHFKNGSVQV